MRRLLFRWRGELWSAGFLVTWLDLARRHLEQPGDILGWLMEEAEPSREELARLWLLWRGLGYGAQAPLRVIEGGRQGAALRGEAVRRPRLSLIAGGAEPRRPSQTPTTATTAGVCDTFGVC